MTQPDLPNVLSCPLEILWKIFLELVPDAQAIRTCRLVCRTFFQGVESSLQLRIFLKCNAWGYRQPSFGTNRESINMLEFSEKLDLHVRSWGDLDWHESHVRIPSPGAAYALSQGVFASVSFQSELSSVTCVTLPSRIMGTTAAIHTLEDVGFPVKDLVLDPSQDLLILLEMYAILKTLALNINVKPNYLPGGKLIQQPGFLLKRDYTFYEYRTALNTPWPSILCSRPIILLIPMQPHSSIYRDPVSASCGEKSTETRYYKYGIGKAGIYSGFVF